MDYAWIARYVPPTSKCVFLYITYHITWDLNFKPTLLCPCFFLSSQFSYLQVVCCDLEEGEDMVDFSECYNEVLTTKDLSMYQGHI